ncbi:hypothetical protein ROZALSC1DRAFT_24979, partial [Rozella allomycis CSF55]
GRYVFPSFVSEKMKNLLSKMLVVDPLQRITIEQIKEHELFQQGLPEYLRETFCAPENEKSIFENLDLAIVEALAKKLTISDEDVIKQLGAKDSNATKVAYQLLYDHASTIKHSMENIATGAGELDSSLPIAIPMNEYYAAVDDDVRSSISILPASLNKESVMNRVESRAKKHRKRTKWHFGIRSRGAPKKIMYEIYKAMKNIDLEWKPLNAYHAKFEIQLFRADTNNYVVDFRNVIESWDNATNFNFFDICCKLMFELSISD